MAAIYPKQRAAVVPPEAAVIPPVRAPIRPFSSTAFLYDIRESQLLRDLTNAEETVRAGYPMLYEGTDRIISIRYKDLYINNKEALIAAMRKDVESKGEAVPAAEAEILGIDADAKPTADVDSAEDSYYIEFEMYVTDEQMQENGGLYADYSGRRHYYIDVKPEEMPVTFALLSSPDFM